MRRLPALERLGFYFNPFGDEGLAALVGCRRAAAVGRGVHRRRLSDDTGGLCIYLCATLGQGLAPRTPLRSDSAARCARETRRAGALSGNTIARIQ